MKKCNYDNNVPCKHTTRECGSCHASKAYEDGFAAGAAYSNNAMEPIPFTWKYKRTLDYRRYVLASAMCGNCGDDFESFGDVTYCPNCGVKIDWRGLAVIE